MQKVVVALKELFELTETPVTNEKLALFARSLQHLDEDFVLGVITDIKYERRSSFPLKFSEIIDYAHKRAAAEHPSPEDAWGLIIQAIKKGYKGWETLPENVQRAVNNVCPWQDLRNTDNLFYYRSAVINAYKAVIEEVTQCKIKPTP